MAVCAAMRTLFPMLKPPCPYITVNGLMVQLFPIVISPPCVSTCAPLDMMQQSPILMWPPY